jgi:hypothetical protein
MPDRPDALAALDVFVGEWAVQAVVPDAPPGRAVFEWALAGHYLVQRTTSPLPQFPDSLAIVGYDHGSYLQHYFDSRGAARLYRMSWDAGLWTLVRATADFSPLEFAQRFVGTLSADSKAIDGQWETSHDGGRTWELDFGFNYARVP